MLQHPDICIVLQAGGSHTATLELSSYRGAAASLLCWSRQLAEAAVRLGASCDTACSAPRPAASGSHAPSACAARSFAAVPAAAERPQNNTCGSCHMSRCTIGVQNALLRGARSGDHTVKLVCCRTGACVRVLTGHRRTPWVVRFHPRSSALLASGSLDYEARPPGALRGVCVAAGGRLQPLCMRCACGAAPRACITDCAAVGRPPARRGAVLRPSSGPAPYVCVIR